MGGKGDKGEPQMEWSTQNTKVLIDLIYDRVKKKQLQTSTFKATVWKEINIELSKETGENYGVERLKGKFNRLRTMYREFSTLLGRTGVTWDLQTNKVNAPEDVWQDLYTKGRFYKQFKKHGFEYDYNILGEIFNTSTASGKMSYPSTQKPLNSDEERAQEEDFLTTGVHVVEVNTETSSEAPKKNKATTSSSEPRQKYQKRSKLDRLESCFQSLSQSIIEKNERKIAESRAREERCKANTSEVTSAEFDPYSIDECMELLNSLEDVSDEIYCKALERFTNADWRRIFIKMPHSRRSGWLQNL